MVPEIQNRKEVGLWNDIQQEDGAILPGWLTQNAPSIRFGEQTGWKKVRFRLTKDVLAMRVVPGLTQIKERKPEFVSWGVSVLIMIQTVVMLEGCLRCSIWKSGGIRAVVHLGEYEAGQGRRTELLLWKAVVGPEKNKTICGNQFEAKILNQNQQKLQVVASVWNFIG